MRVLVCLCALWSACLLSDGAYSEDELDTALLGDFGGSRTSLESSGITINAISTNDIVSNVSGGLHRRTKILGNFDLTAEVDTKSAGLWDDGTFFFYGLGNYGGDPTSYVGDAQASNNIEAYDTAKLYEAWYNHTLLEGKVDVLVGLHDYNSEFDALENAAVLINSSFGISPETSQVGPSIFSTTALALRLKVQPFSGIYVQSALYDGVPGNPNDPRGTHVDFRDGDGLFWGSEVGVTNLEEEPCYKVALGHWLHTAEFEDYAGRERDDNQGMYLIAERRFWSETDPAQGLGGFLQLGYADGHRNQISHYYGGGLTYTGLLADRDNDIAAIGYAFARNGSEYVNAGDRIDRAEYAFELTYRAEITKYFAVQPDIQFILNPGMDSTIQDAVVLGIRTEVGL